MTFSFVRVFVEASALWRRERRLVVPVAGVFFFLPLLGLILLLDGIQIAPDATSEQLRAALTSFSDANVLPLLLISLWLDFGTFALLTLYLQGGECTLGEVLIRAVQRFFLFEVIAVVTRVLFTIGASLFLLPGLFAVARTWLAAPALAARPEAGISGALREGWQRSRALAWIVLLGAMTTVTVAGLFVLLSVSILFGTIGAAIGDTIVVPMLGYVACAALGSMIWIALALVQVAAYRLSEPSTGI